MTESETNFEVIDTTQEIASIFLITFYGGFLVGACCYSTWKHHIDFVKFKHKRMENLTKDTIKYAASKDSFVSEEKKGDDTDDEFTQSLDKLRARNFEKSMRKLEAKGRTSSKYHFIKSMVKLILREVWYIRGIYFIIMIHLFDTITDYLLLIEWYYYGLSDTNDNDINYFGVFVVSIIILLIYRLVSGYYLYEYYQKSLIHLIGQLIDINIIWEVKESHLHYKLTDNLRYLSKLEKSYESAPQLLLQLYVILRTINNENVENITYVAVLSALMSFVSLTTKLISDDRDCFFIDCPANKQFPPKWPFIARCLFRLAELMSRLLLYTLVAAYFGAWFLIFWIFIELIANTLLFDRVC